ncbi:MAG: acyl-CoA dehydratase activase [Chloroflexi bacterium]|nr:acyl-CoA dehydratase activase [Chloroflexota bacterium]MDA8189141.1 acyl-CoA dehydratase activase [Dehalococcoidales bacterium]
MKAYLGIDVGSVTTKFAVIDESDQLVVSQCIRTQGKPIAVIQQGMRDISRQLPEGTEIIGVGTTGSARYLTGVVVGADVVKNEITAHAVGALQYVPKAQTVLEIGGQDSKIIIMRDGIVVDFAMNTVCAAGTGAFLDQQASRLSMNIEDFGPLALQSKTPVRIAGRCTVFAESDMIHKQQMGHSVEDILYGLCEAMARNYLNNLGLGKEILPPVVFQGGVAANKGIVRAFEAALKTEVVVPPHHQVMGAIGAALLAHEHMSMNGSVPTKFKGFGVSETEYGTSSFECKSCSNVCEIVVIKTGRETIARWGGRCGMWDV